MAIPMEKNYYFLGASLPEITLGQPVEMGYPELRFLMLQNLDEVGAEQLRRMQTYFDIQNMLSLWIGRDFSSYGNFDREELEEAMVSGVGLAEYIVEFLAKYEKAVERAENVSELMSHYFTREISRGHGFVKEFLIQERDARLVLTALRAKALKRDLLKELQFESVDDSLVRQILSQKDAETYEPPAQFQSLKRVWEENKESPMKLFQMQAQLRFEWVEEQLGVALFSLARVLGYALQLISAEQWLAMSVDKGNQILDKLVKDSER